MSQSQLRICIAEKDAQYRRTLRFLLSLEPDFVVLAEAGDGISAIEMVEEQRPDLVIAADLLPLLSGIELCRIIKAKFPQTNVVILSFLTDDGTRLKAAEAGASGFLSKEAPFWGMLALIRSFHHFPATVH